MNTSKSISVKFGDELITARVISGAANEDARNYRCTDKKCRGARKWPIVDITQYGFEWDQLTSIFRCSGCGEFTAVRYQVEFK